MIKKMMHQMQMGIGFLALVFFHMLILPHASAQYPERPIKIIVPFAPGGGTDLVARTIGQSMSEDLRQPIVIENKPGGSTIIGTEALAKSAPDGYTLVIATFAHAVNPSLPPLHGVLWTHWLRPS